MSVQTSMPVCVYLRLCLYMRMFTTDVIRLCQRVSRHLDALIERLLGLGKEFRFKLCFTIPNGINAQLSKRKMRRSLGTSYFLYLSMLSPFPIVLYFCPFCHFPPNFFRTYSLNCQRFLLLYINNGFVFLCSWCNLASLSTQKGKKKIAWFAHDIKLDCLPFKEQMLSIGFVERKEKNARLTERRNKCFLL